MGKANRIRNQRATAAINAPVNSTKKNQGMPSWAMNLIAIAITAFVVIMVATGLLSANGVFGRITTAMASDNFRVSENVMRYFYSEAASAAGSKATVEQVIETAKSNVKTILALCEEANKRGIALDEEDQTTIDTQIQMYELYAQYYGYTSVNSFISASFGKGVNKSDVEKALSLSILADKCGEVLSDELIDKITSGEIDAKYLENKNDYDVADYAYYTYKVTYADAAEAVLGKSNYTKDEETEKAAEILEKFKELVAEAKEKANAFGALATVEDLKNYIIDNEIDGVYDDEYDEIVAPGHSTDDGHNHDKEDIIAIKDLPNADDLKVIREKAIAHLKELLKAGKKYEKLSVENTEAKNATVFDITVTSAFAKVFEKVMESAYAAGEDVVEKYVVEAGKYKDSDKAIKWVFEEARKAGDVTTYEEGSGATVTEGDAFPTEASKIKTFSTTVYRVIKTRYQDETLTRELAIMIFPTKIAAEAAAGRLTAGMTLEQIKALSDELMTTYQHYENYVEGQAKSDVFDEWVFAESTVVGSYTSTPLEISKDQTYVVAYYLADAEAVWYLDVRSDILEEKYEETVKTLENTYVIKANDKVIAKIGA